MLIERTLICSYHDNDTLMHHVNFVLSIYSKKAMTSDIILVYGCFIALYTRFNIQSNIGLNVQFKDNHNSVHANLNNHTICSVPFTQMFRF